MDSRAKEGAYVGFPQVLYQQHDVNEAVNGNDKFLGIGRPRLATLVQIEQMGM